MNWSRTAVVFLAILLVAPTGAHAQDAEAPQNVRGTDCWANEALERGLNRSALVRELVAALEASDVIVHVETRTPMPVGISGMTRLVVGAGDSNHRYLRVTLDRNLLPNERASTLAHELQHAWELADSTVRTSEAVVSLYLRIGRRVGGAKGYFETREAQQAGARAWVELRTGRPSVASASQD